MRPAAPLLSLSLLTLLAAAGCCPEGEINLVEGSEPVPLGETVSMEFVWQGEVASGPDDCTGYWYVDDILWGNAEIGDITVCGTYTAPDNEVSRNEVRIEAMEFEKGTCADCCPYGWRYMGVGG